MAYQKGHNKTGGREKGSPNKLTKELRTLLKDLFYTELSSIEDRLNELDTKERIELLIKLMPYVLPKVEQAPHTTDEPDKWGWD